MTATPLILALLTVSVVLNLSLERWRAPWAGHRRESIIQTLLGETRSLLAQQLHRKADAYFLNGAYPNLLGVQSEGGHCSDWLESFSRHFFPSGHIHITDSAASQSIDEVLPWLELAVVVDPTHAESYIVGAFVLRKIQRYKEAEEFLARGLASNPEDIEMLFEMGDFQWKHRTNLTTARLFWTRAQSACEKSATHGRSDPTLCKRVDIFLKHLDTIETP